MFKPKAIYIEKGIENYELGKELLKKFEDIPKIENTNIKSNGTLNTLATPNNT